MKEELIITNYCKIKNNKVFFNEDLIFQSEPEKKYNDFIKQAYRYANINYQKFFKMDNLSKLGFLSAEFIFKEKSIFSEFKPDEIGIILSNSSSSLDTDITFNETIKNSENYFPSPSVFVYTLPNIMIGEICIKHKISGENTFFVFEKYNIEFLYNYITYLFKLNKIKCCITGWIELFRGNYESILYMVKKAKDCVNIKEYVKFEPENIKKIWKS